MKNLTKHRKIIFDSLRERRDHPTAKMVFDTVRERTDKISFATVYNSLEFLVKEKMILKLNIDSDSCRYDAFTHDHSHLICRVCGDVADYQSLNLKEKIDFKNTGFQPETVTITIKGKCRFCSKTKV